MIYGLNARVFIENGPTAKIAQARAQRSRARSWRVLDEARRIALVDGVLKPANDRIDAYPIAL